MPNGFDAATDGGRVENAGNILFSHTTGAGSNRAIFVYARNTNGGSPSSVLYGGVTASLIGSMDNGAEHRHHMFVLANPATGANNVIVGYAAQQGFIDAAALTYTGVDQTTQVNANNPNSTSASTSYSPSVVTGADNSWVVACIGNSTGQASAGGGTVLRFSNANGNAWGDNNSDVPTSGTVASVVATRPANANWSGVTAAVSPAIAAVAGNDLTLLGVG